MANFRSIISSLSLILVCAPFLDALFEDQIGKFDWKRSYIGKVKHAKFDATNRLIVTTHENILACLSHKSDQIQWRQTMENPEEHQPLHLSLLDRETVTVSGNKQVSYIRGWDSATGTLTFEWSASHNSDISWTLNDETLIQIASFPGSHIEITHFDVRSGNLKWRNRIGASWTSEKCVLTSEFYVCIANGQLLWINVRNEPKISSQPMKTFGEYTDLVEFDAPKPSVLLVAGKAAKLVEFSESGAQAQPHALTSDSVHIDGAIYQLSANLNNPDKLIKVNRVHPPQSIEIDYPLGLGGPYIVAGRCQDACLILLSSTDNALTLVRLPEGRVLWTREEALANIVAVEFLELPLSDLDASIEKEFAQASNDVISMFTHRISTQWRQLYKFVSGHLLGSEQLVRDDFGLHRMIVVATAAGKLFGIDTLTGKIAWTYRIPNIRAFSDGKMLLLVQRTARFAPLPAQCVLLAEENGMGVVFEFDPITGHSRGAQQLAQPIKQAFLLPHEDDSHVKPVAIVTANDQVYLYPEVKDQPGVYFYVIEGSVLKGYRLGGGLTPVWELNLGLTKILAVSTRPVNERVHSQGRVKPDRSVFYKYVNPNLIALATLSEDPMHKHVVSVYLIDGVTGLILYSASHKKAKGPVHLVHSENWVVYTIFNERHRRVEMVAAELYEGPVQSNSSVFSSYSLSQLPQVRTESYILPANPVAMTVTLTERGITNKFLLVGMSSGSVVEIPWMLLQPRFDDMACGPEESCIPYMPEVPLPPEATINYNQTLGRMKGIVVAPAKLESTCHVLVHGLDLFYTRVAPSKTFDLLKEDFDHRLIVLVLSGLVLASYVTKLLAAKKTMRQAWK